MIKVVEIAEKLLLADGIAMESLRRGLLNFSAYAAQIHPQIEELTKKPVKKGTVVVALTRLSNKIGKAANSLASVKISDLSVKSSLCSLTYEKTPDIQRKVAVLSPFQVTLNDIFLVVDGQSEVTLVIAERAKERIGKHFAVKPKAQINSLAAVTVQISQKTIAKNAQFALLTSLAAHDIDVIESASAFLETSFIVLKESVQDSVGALGSYLEKN